MFLRMLTLSFLDLDRNFNNALDLLSPAIAGAMIVDHASPLLQVIEESILLLSTCE